jgi:hypothetical protein
MGANFRKFIITFLISVGIGCGATYLIASSANGYVAGFIVLPLFLLIGAASLILLLAGFICLGLENKSAPWLLLSGVLLPAGFISSAMVAKHFELGAYRQEPMIPISNKVNTVVFKEGTTNDQIEDFWNKTMSVEKGAYERLPGVGTMGRQSRNGQETIVFDFLSNATEEQRQFVFSKIRSSPIVFQFLENETLEEQSASPSPALKIGELKEIKTVTSTDSK